MPRLRKKSAAQLRESAILAAKRFRERNREADRYRNSRNLALRRQNVEYRANERIRDRISRSVRRSRKSYFRHSERTTDPGRRAVKDERDTLQHSIKWENEDYRIEERERDAEMEQSQNTHKTDRLEIGCSFYNLMNCIDLDDEDDCVMVESSKPAEPEKTKKNLNLERKLIKEVRKHRLLYDSKHRLFRNVAKKEIVWQQIAETLNADVDFCKNTWVELRHSYQKHARRLRKYFLNGHKENRKRAAMHFETELVFLWRFIETRKTCPLPFEIMEDNPAELEEVEHVQFGIEDVANKVIDDDLILVEDPVECIVIDEDDDNKKVDRQFKITPAIKTLIKQIKSYPELYDSQHTSFKDYTRKSFIWNAIASNIGDKATKLMKCWIIIQTRYEWELNHIPTTTDPSNSSPPSDLQNVLGFLKNHILINPDTVYKDSYYLQTAWHEPIDYFKEIYNLIVRMKKMPDIVYVTDSLLKTSEKTTEYHSLWGEMANLKSSTAGQCEATWLIMRHFYWELMNMRQHNYQLTDKWYFETVITELYDISNKLAKEKTEHQLEQEQTSKDKSQRQSLPPSASMPMRTESPIRNELLTQMTPTIINNLTPPPTMTHDHQGPLPKITAAISLAPQALTGAPLQIRPVTMPTMQPSPQILNGLTALPASNGAGTSQTSYVMSVNIPQQPIANTVVPTALIRAPHAPPAPQIAQNVPPTATLTVPSLIRNITPASAIRNLAPASKPVKTLLNPTSLRNLRAQGFVTSALAPSSSNVSVITTINNKVINPQQMSNSLNMFNLNNNLNPKLLPTNNTTSAPSSNNHQTQIPTPSPQTNSPAPAMVTTISSSPAGADTAPHLPNQPDPQQQSPLPKISGAVSLLNPNEILIELIASQNGNHLVVHGPPLSEKYQLSMPTVAKFIREVLAIPLLHNKRHNQPMLINSYWEHISKLFNLPPHICRACWNFLVENFNHFPQIAPMKDLMAPFRTTLTVWKESQTLFQNFNDHCVVMGWLKHMSRLPEVVECIGTYPILYHDLAKEPLAQAKSVTDMEVVCAWRTLSLRFPKINDLQDIWLSIKNCFCQYMSDLEFGVNNKWPLNWWRSFARLKFLVEAKYSTNEPYYYIVCNKMVEEIDKCAYKHNSQLSNKRTEIPLPKIIPKTEILEEEELLQKPRISTSHLPIKQIETVALLTAIQKHPAIYEKCDYITKLEAWEQVAKELQMEVFDCMEAFRIATKKYFTYKKLDVVSRCRLNQKYYKKFEEIFRSKPGRCKLNIKTPFELNQSITDPGESSTTSSSADLVFPERYISDISMSNSPINLVIKNWNYALGNLPPDTFNGKFRSLLNKYV